VSIFARSNRLLNLVPRLSLLALLAERTICLAMLMMLVIYLSVKPADRGKKDALESLKREIAILKKVDHPNIVKLHEVQK
jgi:serine/threonine protein kinase